MDDKKITVKELQLAMEQEFTEMIQEVVDDLPHFFGPVFMRVFPSF